MNDHTNARLGNALRIARMTLEQGGTLNTRTAANGPTVGQVIDDALALADFLRKLPDDVTIETIYINGQPVKITRRER